MPFEIGQIFRRRELHERYGGQEQGGISTPAKHPFIFLFSSDSGELYGYKDGWQPDGSYRYTGEGQVGDMQFVRGNLAIRDHLTNGKELHVFKQAHRAQVEYVGQMIYGSHQFVEGVPDVNKNPRVAIVFRLMPVDDPHR
jgi:5-methylcytosine-specific restriction protein A